MVALRLIVPLLIVQGLFLARASAQDCRPCEPKARECCPPVGAQCSLKCPKAIGALLPLTGPTAVFGKQLQEAFEFGVERANREVSGGPFLPVFADTEGKPEVGVAKIKAELVPRGVLALLDGVGSGVVLATGQSARDFKIPMVVGSATADALTRTESPWVFRIGPSLGLLFEPVASFLIDIGKDARTIQILTSREWQTDFASLINTLRGKGKNARTFVVDSSAVDFGPVLAQLSQTKPDGVVIGVFGAQLAGVARTVKSAGYTPKFIAIVDVGGIGLERLMPALPAEIRNGVYVSGIAPSVPRPEQLGVFEKDFSARFGRSPGTPEIVAYSSLMVVARGIGRAAEKAAREKASLSHESVRAALQELNVSTPFGRVTFKAFGGFWNQNPSIENNQAVLRQWQDGKLRIVWPLSAREAAPLYPMKN